MSQTQSKGRPAIKNNLNEQLKIYYNYRDENNQKSSQKCSISQFNFRHIPDQPPAIKQRSIIASQPVSFTTKRDSTPLKKLQSSSNLHSQQVQHKLDFDDNFPDSDFKEFFEPSPKINSTQSKPKLEPLPKINSQPKFEPLPRINSQPKFIESPSVSSANLCPLCRIAFDIGGVHRPVSDACGHTTCFQCFREVMLNGTGCSLCQKEKNQSKTNRKCEAEFFDDWSLNESSTSKTKLKSIRSFDHDDDNDFENANPSIINDEEDEEDEDEEENDKVTWISNDVHDDGPEYQNKQFHHTKSMLERFHALFGLRKFRSNQQEAVNCALERRFHVFVLMPTGGGKSLCYQLPSVIDHGVTFVVSPLRSLILDQTQKLTSLGIPCASLTGDRTAAEVSAIYAQCYSPQPKLKIVYVTPEKIGQSDQLNKLFTHLYTKKNLARFVIDEAHCISDWGHDFRPDYVKIGGLRERYPEVPFTLLTATATPRVQRDMLYQMKIERHLCKLFIQSFNRSNLVYKCFTKGKTEAALSRIVQLCKSEQFVGLCGIVYCFSRMECERTASYLSTSGVTAQAYHAGLEDQERADVQTRWADDEYQVICATIAFGMGIDKPNVRFVIHLSMPKSIEGYYQESGRAGRDGEQAYCYLFYSYQDLVKTKRLIMAEQSSNSTREARKVRLDNLHRVYQYCLNDVDCRRTLLLEYFGEQYLSSQCKKHYQTRCDNCCNVAQTKSVDFTQLSKHIFALVDQLTNNSKQITLYQIVDILKGSKQKSVIDAGHNQLEQYNIADQVTRTNLERLLSKLILDGYLHQDISVNDTYGSATAYIRLGNRRDFTESIQLSVCAKKENTNVVSEKSTNCLRNRLVDQCLIKLKDELKQISSEYNIKYSTILSEKALKQMATTMPRTKEDMLKKTVELTRIKYEMYKLDRLLSITCSFGSKLDEEKPEDSTTSSGLKRKRDAPITSSYFQDKTSSKKKK